MKLLPIFFLICLLVNAQAEETTIHELRLVQSEDTQTLSLFKADHVTALITQNAKESFRPYLHPLIAPDGKGALTQFSPGHHKHQTGIYWAFTRVNGRDYFHHPEETHWKRKSVKLLKGQGSEVSWKTVYLLLGEDGSPVMEESQSWTVSHAGRYCTLDLEWTGKAEVDLTVEKYNYGGLFLRMPYLKGADAEARNAQEQRNQETEGASTEWVHVGMEIPGRDDWGNITVFDHPDNPGYPNLWRVDRQFGFGPASARSGAWTLKRGESRTYRHRLLVYTGQLDQVLINQIWEDWAGDDSQDEGQNE
ncbi:MAG: PmoA family protein [Verrucomicrobiota bacterium]